MTRTTTTLGVALFFMISWCGAEENSNEQNVIMIGVPISTHLERPVRITDLLEGSSLVDGFLYQVECSNLRVSKLESFAENGGDERIEFNSAIVDYRWVGKWTRDGGANYEFYLGISVSGKLVGMVISGDRERLITDEEFVAITEVLPKTIAEEALKYRGIADD